MRPRGVFQVFNGRGSGFFSEKGAEIQTAFFTGAFARRHRLLRRFTTGLDAANIDLARLVQAGQVETEVLQRRFFWLSRLRLAARARSAGQVTEAGGRGLIGG